MSVTGDPPQQVLRGSPYSIKTIRFNLDRNR